ncbi:MAG: hypothetical protein Q8K12_14100 [Thiobacillus sp.]|nr:hypothetical protein [Thiobacillus sp.]
MAHMKNGQGCNEIVLNAVSSWQYLARTKNDTDALKRLIEYAGVREAWGKLANKIDGDKFERLVMDIVRAAIGAHMRQSDKKTAREIRETAKEAADLTDRLIKLIERNGTLQSLLREDILSHPECAALDRLEGALDAARTEKPNNSGIWFTPEIEAELDKNQERRHPENAGLTTSDTVRLVFRDNMYLQHRVFVSHLRNFAKFAKLSENFPPLTASPNAKSADQQVYALRVCNLINNCCGNPNHEIAADLVSAVFNAEVDAEKVKKWWQRQGDKFQ